ncbi:putative F-box/FBD/LRR-repeat protein-like [Capsicum annuum]|nr:putative F-box/FBD/LRR-repeat protein-like [Capsicum annuum]
MDQGKSMSHNRDITTGHQTPSEGISVKIFSADTGKYLDQQNQQKKTTTSNNDESPKPKRTTDLPPSGVSLSCFGVIGGICTHLLLPCSTNKSEPFFLGGDGSVGSSLNNNGVPREQGDDACHSKLGASCSSGFRGDEACHGALQRASMAVDGVLGTAEHSSTIPSILSHPHLRNPNDIGAADAAARVESSISTFLSNLSQLHGHRLTVTPLANAGLDGGGSHITIPAEPYWSTSECSYSNSSQYGIVIPVDWHKPPVVALLETKMQDHLPLLNDYPFNRIIEVPAVGNAGGLAVLWDDSLLELDDIATTDQEIHTLVKIGMDVNPACFFYQQAETLDHIIRDLLQELGITWVQREDRRTNGAADILAKEGRKKESTKFLEEWTVPPLFIRQAIAIDKEGTSFDEHLLEPNSSIVLDVNSMLVRHYGPATYNRLDMYNANMAVLESELTSKGVRFFEWAILRPSMIAKSSACSASAWGRFAPKVLPGFNPVMATEGGRIERGDEDVFRRNSILKGFGFRALKEDVGDVFFWVSLGDYSEMTPPSQEDEKVKGKRVLFSDTSCRFEILRFRAIYEDGNGSGGDTGHDKRDGWLRKSKELECFLDEELFQSVKDFFKAFIGLKDFMALVILESVKGDASKERLEELSMVANSVPSPILQTEDFIPPSSIECRGMKVLDVPTRLFIRSGEVLLKIADSLQDKSKGVKRLVDHILKTRVFDPHRLYSKRSIGMTLIEIGEIYKHWAVGSCRFIKEPIGFHGMKEGLTSIALEGAKLGSQATTDRKCPTMNHGLPCNAFILFSSLLNLAVKNPCPKSIKTRGSDDFQISAVFVLASHAYAHPIYCLQDLIGENTVVYKMPRKFLSAAKLSSPINYLKSLCLSGIYLDESVELFVALCLIRSSPYLQDIQMKFDYSDELFFPLSGDVISEIPASFTDVTLNHLRSVKLEGISGTKTEIEFINLLLAKSPMLVRMLIQPKMANESAETRLKVRAEITKFPRASTKAEVDYRLDDNRV